MSYHHTHRMNHTKTTELPHADEDNQYYALVGKPLGSGQFEITIVSTGASGIAQIRGNIRKGPKKQIIQQGKYALVQDISYDQTGQYYITHQYSDDQVKKISSDEKFQRVTAVADTAGTSVTYEGAAASAAVENAEIDEDFIAGI